MGPSGQETLLSVSIATSLFQRLSFVCHSYWDWAEPSVEKEGLPPVLYEDKLEITVAKGKTTTVDNPFSFCTYQVATPPSSVGERSESVCYKKVHLLLLQILIRLFVD